MDGVPQDLSGLRLDRGERRENSDFLHHGRWWRTRYHLVPCWWRLLHLFRLSDNASWNNNWGLNRRRRRRRDVQRIPDHRLLWRLDTTSQSPALLLFQLSMIQGVHDLWVGWCQPQTVQLTGEMMNCKVVVSVVDECCRRFERRVRQKEIFYCCCCSKSRYRVVACWSMARRKKKTRVRIFTRIYDTIDENMCRQAHTRSRHCVPSLLLGNSKGSQHGALMSIWAKGTDDGDQNGSPWYKAVEKHRLLLVLAVR